MTDLRSPRVHGHVHTYFRDIYGTVLSDNQCLSARTARVKVLCCIVKTLEAFLSMAINNSKTNQPTCSQPPACLGEKYNKFTTVSFHATWGRSLPYLGRIRPEMTTNTTNFRRETNIATTTTTSRDAPRIVAATNTPVDPAHHSPSPHTILCSPVARITRQASPTALRRAGVRERGPRTRGSQSITHSPRSPCAPIHVPDHALPSSLPPPHSSSSSSSSVARSVHLGPRTRPGFCRLVRSCPVLCRSRPFALSSCALNNNNEQQEMQSQRQDGHEP
jgi:hypothetical protein